MNLLILIVGVSALIVGLWMLGLSLIKACKHLKGDNE